MSKQHYFPGSEGDQIPWLKNYGQKFEVHCSTLGMGAKVSSTQFDMAYAIFLLEPWPG